MSKRPAFRLAASAWAILLALFAATCGSSEPTPKVEPTSPPPAVAAPGVPQVTPVPPRQIPQELECDPVDPGPVGPSEEFECAPPPGAPAPFFVPRYVIVTGPESQVEAVVQDVANTYNLRFTPVHQLCLTYVDDVLGTCPNLAFAPDETFEDLAGTHFLMRLYRVDGCLIPADVIFLNDQDKIVQGPVTPEFQAMVRINMAAMAGHPPLPVAAELSYEVGGPTFVSFEELGSGTSGSEWMGAGSPWADVAIPPVCADPALSFVNEWIWRTSPGIDLSGASGAEIGTSVRVGVFDTSPWEPNVTIPNWGLDVEGLPFGPLYTFPQGRIAVVDHGAFVAALLHAVAPGADIRLYPVLDSYARGDLYTLNASLHRFIQEAIYDRDKGAIGAAAINLSLGVHSAQDVIKRGLPEPDWPKLGLSSALLGAVSSWSGERSGAPSLRLLLAAARCHGIPTVAAAGNESSGSASAVPAQMPASFTGISLAIGSSNSLGVASCFSNSAGVYAPGGEGCTTYDAQGACSDCEPVDNCAPECQISPDLPGQASPPFCVSKYLFAPTSHNYVYWAGTSFSTPLVTGAVARYLEKQAGTALAPFLVVEDAFTRMTQCAHIASALSPGPTPASGPKVDIIDVRSVLGMGTCP